MSAYRRVGVSAVWSGGVMEFSLRRSSIVLVIVLDPSQLTLQAKKRKIEHEHDND